MTLAYKMPESSGSIENLAILKSTNYIETVLSN